MTNRKDRETLSLNKTEETKELEQEKAALEEELKELEAGNGVVDVDPSEGGIDPVDIDEEFIEENNLAAAARKGRTRSNPRFIEAAKRDLSTIDLGGLDLKMTINDRNGQTEGYHTHWIIDKPGRIERLLGMGYEPIYKDGVKIGTGADDFNENQDTWVSMISGTLEGGAPQRSYAMKIRQELYDLYQEKKRERIREVEDQIRNGTHGQQAGDNRYATIETNL